MKIDKPDLRKTLKVILFWIKRYGRLVMFVLIMLLFSWLVSRINSYNRREPDEQAVADRLQAIKRPKIDQATINKIQQLQDNSVEVQTLFKQARENPFQE